MKNLIMIILVAFAFNMSAQVKSEDLVQKGSLFMHNGAPYTGKAIDYYPNDKVRGEEYYKNGKEDGEWKAFFPNGKVWVVGKYVNGNKEGVWKYYNMMGGFVENKTFKNGVEQ